MLDPKSGSSNESGSGSEIGIFWTTGKVLAGTHEANVLQRMRDADSRMLLLGVWITKTFDPKWANTDIYEESRAAGIPIPVGTIFLI